MTTADLDAMLRELERMEKAATPGPWRWSNWSTSFGDMEDEPRLDLEANAGGGDGAEIARRDGPEAVLVMSLDEPPDNRADLALVKNARNALPVLLELARLACEARDDEEFARGNGSGALSNDWLARFDALTEGARHES